MTLNDAISKLGEDELRLLTLIAERLVTGRKTYGALDIAADKRDWAHEALEEAADGLVYVAAELIRGGHRRV